MTNRASTPFTNNDPSLTGLQNELQETRLALVEAQAQIARLNRDLEGLRLRQAEQQQEVAQIQLEALFREAAGPLAQLAVQAFLYETTRPVQTRDVLAVTKRLQRVLEKYGMELEGMPGLDASFDPDRHVSLSSGVDLRPGQPVLIRVPGATYHGQVLARALVEPAGENS